MLTDAFWLKSPDVIRDMTAGIDAGLAERRQQLSEQEAAQGPMEAGQRLRLAYDTLAAQQQNQRREAAQQALQTAATLSLRQLQSDALSNYRAQQIQDQQERLKQAAAKTALAADALKASHDDTAAFVEDAKTMSAADAYSKHPNADRVVVNHVMSLEAEKAKQPKTPTDKVETTELVPVTAAKPGVHHWFSPDEPPVAGVTNRVTTTRYLSPSDRLSAQTEPSLSPLPAPSSSEPKAEDLVAVINPQGKRVRIKKSDLDAALKSGYSNVSQ